MEKISAVEGRRESPEEDPVDSVVLQCETSLGKGARPSWGESDNCEKEVKLSLRRSLRRPPQKRNDAPSSECSSSC